MDDFTTEIIASGRAFDSPESPERHRRVSDGSHDEEPAVEPEATPAPPQKTGLRGGLAAIRQKASLQDRLVEKFVVL
jgi:hypothetical protein